MVQAISFGRVYFMVSILNAVYSQKVDRSLEIYMPHVQPTEDDQYLCTTHKLPIGNSTVYIKGISLKFKEGRAHHYLLYGCYKIPDELLKLGHWACNTKKSCSGRKQIPIGLKQKDPLSNTDMKLTFPSGVAYPVGLKYKINYIVLEVHYLKAIPKGTTDNSGISIHTTEDVPQFLSGSLVFARAGFQIPPQRDKFSLDMNCKLGISQPIYPYAAWVHTHDLGSVVSGYVIHPNYRNKSLPVSDDLLDIKELIRWTHHWPQPVSLLSKRLVINSDDIVAGKCTYNSSGKRDIVHWGSRRSDEMCNLFLSFYTSVSTSHEELSLTCVNEMSRKITNILPKNASDLPLRKPFKTEAVVQE